MSYSDVEYSKISELSYLDIPKDLEKRMNKYKEAIASGKSDYPAVTMKDLADYYLNNEDGKKILDLSNPRDISIKETLEKFQSGEIPDAKIVDYTNENRKNGLAAMAIETEPGSVTVAYRGSELAPEPWEPKANSKDMGPLAKFEDWIDNFRLAHEVDTSQQEAARMFLENIGQYYDTINITGHSKGGNDGMYAAVTVSKEIRDKIKYCPVFNAPCFDDKFIEKYSKEIKELRDRDVIVEFQGAGDFVSSLLNSIGRVVVLKEVDIDGKGPFDDHYIHNLELTPDGKNFLVKEDGMKNEFPIFVNKLVENLVTILPDYEIKRLIDKAEFFLNLENKSLTEIILNCLELGIRSPETNLVILTTLATIAHTVMARMVEIAFDKVVSIVKEFAVNTLDFIENSMNVAKDFVVDAFVKLEEDLLGGAKDFIRKIASGPMKINPVGGLATVTIAAIKNYDFNSKNDTKCIVTPQVLKDELRVYREQREQVQATIKEIDTSLKDLVSSGWSGSASQLFINSKFTLYKIKMKKCEKQIISLINYIDKASGLFAKREEEEKKLASIFST